MFYSNGKRFIPAKNGVVIIHDDGVKEFIRETWYDWNDYRVLNSSSENENPNFKRQKILVEKPVSMIGYKITKGQFINYKNSNDLQ